MQGWKYLFTVTIGLFGDEGFPADGKEESHAIAIAQHEGGWEAACSHHPQPRPYTAEMQAEWTSMTIYCLYQDDSLPDGRTPLSTGMTYEIWQEKDVPTIVREEPSRWQGRHKKKKQNHRQCKLKETATFEAVYR